jgi:hypothetical protein
MQLRNLFRQLIALRAGTPNKFIVPARQAGNRFPGSLKGLQIRAQDCRVVVRRVGVTPPPPILFFLDKYVKTT